MPNQVRFTQLIKAAGKPHAASLWVADPQRDPEFKKAIAENRIITVHTVNVGTKKDAAHIGFVAEKGASYLIFPKPLPMAGGSRVVGLKYDMLEDVAVKDPVKVKDAPRKARAEKLEVAEPEQIAEPSEKPNRQVDAKKSQAKPAATPRFRVNLQYSATANRQIEVEAKSAADAIRAAVKQGKSNPPEKVVWAVDATDVARLP